MNISVLRKSDDPKNQATQFQLNMFPGVLHIIYSTKTLKQATNHIEIFAKQIVLDNKLINSVKADNLNIKH